MQTGHAGDGVTRPYRPIVALLLGGLSVALIAVSSWLAVQESAQSDQADFVRWVNHPVRPEAAILAVVNPLLRPVPIVVVSLLILAWVVVAARGATRRLEVVRALAIALAVSELVAQVLKRWVGEERPLAVLPGLDAHGYPTDPQGNAYPSAHTALAVAAVSALWPWMTWPQRVVCLSFALAVASNRVYIGAHWPVDVLGGAAIGLLAGTLTWLIAWRWPIGGGTSPTPVLGIIPCG